MRKRAKLTITLITATFMLFPIFCFAQNKNETFNKIHFWTKLGKYKLPINEKLTYGVSWNSVNLGNAILETKSLKNINGRKAYNAFLHVATKPFLSSLFDLNAVFESLFDEESKASFEFKSTIKQNGQTKEELIIFNPIEQTYELRIQGEVKRGTTASHTQDILAAVYSIRSLALKLGDIYYLKIHSGEMSYPLTIKVLRKEKIKIKLGEFYCFVIEPFFEGNSKELGLSGRMSIWVSDDKRRLPCYFKLDSQIGLIIAELESVSAW
jgi:hypothetical protein